MKISFQSLTLLPTSQRVQGEVLHSDDSGSMVMLNGVPVKTNQKLAQGMKINGRIEQMQGRQGVLSLQADMVETQGIQSEGLENLSSQDAALATALKRMGLSLTPDLLKAARELLARLNTTPDAAALNALGLLLSRNLSEDQFPILKKYFEGKLRFDRILAKLQGLAPDALRANWNEGKLLEKLFALLDGSEIPEMGSLDGAETEGWIESLQFQEILSQPPEKDQEGRMVFQWPIFWQDQELPDTLEGEAFYPPQGNSERGFSLRLLVSPPRLGKMEVGIHQLQEALWVHFAPQSGETRKLLEGAFPTLSERLSGAGWKSVRMTSGPLPVREHFFASPGVSDIPTAGSPALLDLKV